MKLLHRIAAVLLCVSVPAWAQTQEDKDKPRPPATPGAQDSTINAYFKDGFRFKAADGSFEGHIGGRSVVHYRDLVDRPERGGRTASDTFFVRQARLEATLTFWREWEVKVQTDFPTGTSSTSGTLGDAWVLWKRLPEFNVRVGQIKEPFSQEESTSTRFIEFDERSVLNRLSPARDIGAMANGKIGDGLFEYEVGVFNGSGRAVLDGNDEKDAAARVRLNPFVGDDESSFLRGLRFGVAGTVGNVDRGSIDGLDLTTTELAVKFLDAGGASVIDGQRLRLGAELSWMYQSWGLRGEYAMRTDEVDTATASDEEIELTAWYVAVTWILTGEKKALENRISPAEPFDVSKGTWGAFELALRVANLEVDDEIFDLGIAASTGNSQGVMTITAGLNWWPTRNVRISPNVILERYDDDVTFVSGREEDSLVGYIVRFQMDF